MHGRWRAWPYDVVTNEKIDCNVELLQDKHIPQLSVTNVDALQDIPQLTNMTSFFQSESFVST